MGERVFSFVDLFRHLRCFLSMCSLIGFLPAQKFDVPVIRHFFGRARQQRWPRPGLSRHYAASRPRRSIAAFKLERARQVANLVARADAISPDGGFEIAHGDFVSNARKSDNRLNEPMCQEERQQRTNKRNDRNGSNNRNEGALDLRIQVIGPKSHVDFTHLSLEDRNGSFINRFAVPAPFTSPNFRHRYCCRLKILRNSAKRLSENLALTIFHVSVRDAVIEGVLSCQCVQREGISSGHISGGGIAEIARYRQRPAIELISKRAAGELINRGNHANSQEEHDQRINAADLPFESEASRLTFHWFLLG